MAIENASWMPNSRFCISPITVAAPWFCPVRSSNGLKMTKMAPALEAALKEAPEKPAIPTVWATPGTARAAPAALCTTASVRSSEAPSGSWIAMIA